MISYFKYIQIKHMLMALVILMLFLIGIDQDSYAYNLYIFMSLTGVFFISFKKFRFTELPKQTKYFIFLLLIFSVHVFLRVLVQSPGALFEFYFETIIVMLMSPFFTIYCYHTLAQFKNKNKFFTIMLATVGLACFVFCTILLINYDGTRSIGGLLHTPIHQGNKGMALGLMLLPLLFSNITIKFKVLSSIGILSGITISLISQSRGGWLALIIVFLSVLFFLYRFGEKRSIFLLIVFFSLFIITLIALMPYHHVDDRIILIYANLIDYFNNNNPSTSVGYRLDLWNIALQSIQDNVWLGLGWDKSSSIFVTSDGFIHGQPHNQFLFIFVELGFIGIFLYLSIFLYPAYLCYKFIIQKNSFDHFSVIVALSILIIIEAFMEFNLTDTITAVKSFMIIFITFTIIAFSICFEVKKSNDSVVV